MPPHGPIPVPVLPMHHDHERLEMTYMREQCEHGDRAYCMVCYRAMTAARADAIGRAYREARRKAAMCEANRACEACGQSLTGTRPNRRTCGDRCRQAASRARRK